MDENLKVEVEDSYEGIVTVTWEVAQKRFALDEGDLKRIKAGKIVWVGNIAIYLPEE